jgi:hypothetical protein
VDATKNPPLFKLKDLLGDAVRGRYYTEQLRQATMPAVDFNFKVKWLVSSLLINTQYSLTHFVMPRQCI